MARAALRMNIRDLAIAADVSPTTITRLERGEELYPRTVEAIQAILEDQGIKFIPDNGDGPGVRHKQEDEK
ncbi:helix-turn-helix domain-containing protein [Komagataeibacter diospyri]|uniref:HTH cro/C1-type domain-containing protein n=1 Tax=Komagataeibacter diospyri TaxID=1932662 RepID=A0A4P5NR40_9PROT|nr:hypothetical protein MSKU9_2064 [Komagataeibacter diospyri]